MKLRCIIIDDEFLARKRLHKLLEIHDNLQVVGECRNGMEALELIPVKEPDLIFLDIQMPGMNGFEVLQKLGLKPLVIFTTAYDTYALKAFEINAVDYLLKPFDQERLTSALDRISVLKRSQEASLIEQKLKKLMADYKSDTSDFLTQISINSRGRNNTIFVDDVIYFKSDGNYVNIQTESKSYLYRITMNALNTKLDNDQFLRIHRSLILNKVYIKKCNYSSNNEYLFELKNGEKLSSSRSYKDLIVDYISKEG